ncbi:MAG: tyrosine-type recombinase/integrase, partial [Clostridia bacterium]|nr:tyrosine-type recombinase/integrase [Clostridia bacterium]
YENYVFRSIHNTPLAPQSFYRALVDLVKAYNEQEAVNAASEAREPLFLHNVSPHTFRHTFCTRFCENEPNIKVIQAIMGHSDISITMNTYAEATASAKQDCVTKLQGKIKLT